MPNISTLLIKQLQYRFLFCPRNPTPLTPVAELSASFFGLPKSIKQPTVDLITEWRAHFLSLATLSSEDRAQLKLYDYWRSKEKLWPSFSLLAQFHIEFPTSSISAERVFGVLRHVESPLRTSMKTSTVRIEMAFRCNRCGVVPRCRLSHSVGCSWRCFKRFLRLRLDSFYHFHYSNRYLALENCMSARLSRPPNG